VAQDFGEAMRWYRKGADHRNAFAQKEIGWLYQNGRGVAQDYPEELMRQARRHRNLRRGAVRAEMAVAIEILLMAPVRMSNLTTLDIEENLVRPGQGKALHVVVGAEEVKNREPLEYPFRQKASTFSSAMSVSFDLI